MAKLARSTGSLVVHWVNWQGIKWLGQLVKTGPTGSPGQLAGSIHWVTGSLGQLVHWVSCSAAQLLHWGRCLDNWFTGSWVNWFTGPTGSLVRCVNW